MNRDEFKAEIRDLIWQARRLITLAFLLALLPLLAARLVLGGMEDAVIRWIIIGTCSALIVVWLAGNGWLTVIGWRACKWADRQTHTGTAL